MNSTGNLLGELGNLDISRFSRCRVYYTGRVGFGTAWEYRGGGQPFETEITPEQAQTLFRLQDKFSIVGVMTGESNPDDFERIILDSLPDILVNRYKDGRVEMSSNAQIALYDLID